MKLILLLVQALSWTKLIKVFSASPLCKASELLCFHFSVCTLHNSILGVPSGASQLFSLAISLTRLISFSVSPRLWFFSSSFNSAFFIASMARFAKSFLMQLYEQQRIELRVSIDAIWLGFVSVCFVPFHFSSLKSEKLSMG